MQPSVDSAARKRLRHKMAGLKSQVSPSSFQAIFAAFTRAAEDFAMTQSDILNRKFAYRYLTYLQDFAHGGEEVKPSFSRPACRLICVELERLFMACFFSDSLFFPAVAGIDPPFSKKILA
jgi:hypothetical protein